VDYLSEQHDPTIGVPPTVPAAAAVPSVDEVSVSPATEATLERRHGASQARRTSALVFLGDLLLTVVVLFAFDTDLDDVAMATFITVSTLGLQRAYRRKLTLSVLDDLPKLAFAGAAGVFLGAAASHRYAQLLPVVITAAALIVALTIGRIVTYALIRQLRTRGNLSSRTLVIGGGTIGARLTSNALQHRGLGLVPVGIVDANPVPETQTLDVRLISPERPLSGVITTLQVDTVVVAFSKVNELKLLDTLRTCDRLDCELLVVPRLFELASLTDDMQLVRDVPLTRIRRAPYRSLQWRFKRVFDIAFSAFALLALSPLLAAIAVVIWLTDRAAPVLYRQDRIGVDGAQFTVVKFRSLKAVDEAQPSTQWSAYHDDRLGKVGKFLRATSLDELPQFWNVLIGDMSVVGPRPERPHFAAEFEEAMRHYGARHRVPAGLTGWAAVHGLRGDTSVRERAAYDNYYIENWSLWLDCKIILRTVLAVLRRSGG
jgi:exopolysaccharide biosynthesis polyprenyl glycosylphosphotransferase